MNRNQLRMLAADFPVGHPHRGAAFGEKCEPATLTMLMVAATAVTAVGAISSGMAASDAAERNAAINARNAEIATQQGNADAAQQKRINELRMGSIRAGYGASGVGAEGSPLDVLASSAAQGELDVQNIKYNASLKSMGYTDNAGADQARASGAMSSGIYNAAGIALSGGTKAYGMYTSGTGTKIPTFGSPNSAGDPLQNLG